MAGVEADADARRAAECVDDRGEMLERWPRLVPWPAVCSSRIIVPPRDASSAARRGLGNQRRPSRSVPAVNDPGCMTSASRPSGSARSSSSPKASIDLRAERGIGGGEVDQITVVRDDRVDARFANAPSEQRDFLVRQNARPPLSDRLREDLQRLTAARHRPVHRARQPARD